MLALALVAASGLLLAACSDKGDSARDVVDSFFASAVDSAPPDVDTGAARDALSLLTEEKRTQIESQGLSPSAAVAALAGWQDVPDEGFEIGQVRENGDEATVIVSLHYSGGDTERLVRLARVDGQWRIADIAVVPDTSTPAAAVEAFLAAVFGSVPPSGTAESAQRAVALMTSEAAAELDPGSLSGSLARFVGVQDVPDGGFTVQDASVDGERAEVGVILRYSGGETRRTVILFRDGGWLVESITADE